jgi:hypothetical protein
MILLLLQIVFRLKPDFFVSKGNQAFIGYQSWGINNSTPSAMMMKNK